MKNADMLVPRFSSASWSQMLPMRSIKSVSCLWQIILQWLKMKSLSYESRYVDLFPCFCFIVIVKQDVYNFWKSWKSTGIW